jgi:hypothetical protein
LRRLARRAPEILYRYERGEFKSVRAAALAAGIIKEKSTLEQLRSVWAKASEGEREMFLSEILIAAPTTNLLTQLPLGTLGD